MARRKNPNKKQEQTRAQNLARVKAQNAKHHGLTPGNLPKNRPPEKNARFKTSKNITKKKQTKMARRRSPKKKQEHKHALKA